MIEEPDDKIVTCLMSIIQYSGAESGGIAERGDIPGIMPLQLVYDQAYFQEKAEGTIFSIVWFQELDNTLPNLFSSPERPGVFQDIPLEVSFSSHPAEIGEFVGV